MMFMFALICVVDLIFQKSKKSGNYGKKISYEDFRLDKAELLACISINRFMMVRYIGLSPFQQYLQDLVFP